jgi:hypothetical protein
MLAPIAERCEAAGRERGRPDDRDGAVRAAGGGQAAHGADRVGAARVGGAQARRAARARRRVSGARAAREQVLDLTGQPRRLVARTIREARALVAQPRRRRGRGPQAKAGRGPATGSADLAEKVCRRIAQRLAGEKITDRQVSLADPGARPIGKGRLREPRNRKANQHLNRGSAPTRNAVASATPAPSAGGAARRPGLVVEHESRRRGRLPTWPPGGEQKVPISRPSGYSVSVTLATL